MGEAGQEVAAHGNTHERWPDLSREAEEHVLSRSTAALKECLGASPRGFRAPAFELNPWSIRLLVQAGFHYDSSLMADDFTPYRPRLEDTVPDDGPLRFGGPAALLEFPVSWEFDDFPYFPYTAPNSRLRPALDAAP